MSLEVAEAVQDSPEVPVALRSGNPAAIVWGLAWPAVALNSLQVLNNLLDRFFIGHLPAAALTAQGGSINVLFLMFSIAMAIGTAGTALVSRFFGAGEHDNVRKGAEQTLRFALIAGLIAAILTVGFAPLAANTILPADDREAMRIMAQFLVAYGCGLPAHYAIQALAGSMRGVGDTVSPMVISGLQIFLHMILNCALIFPAGQGPIPGVGFNLGLVGAGVALSISAWLSALGYMVYAGRTPIGKVWALGLPTQDWARRILNIAVPAGTMAFLRVASLTAFTFILASLKGQGSSGIAAMSVAFALESIMFMPAFGLSMAAAALVGQSLGAKRPDKAERFAWAAAHHGGVVTFTLSLAVYIAAPQIVGVLILGKPEIQILAVWLLRALCVTETLFSYAMVLIGAMQGAGDTKRPMWISIFSMWGLRVPLAFLFALTLHLGANGAYAAMALTQGVQGILSMVAFKFGAWKTMRV